jgi:hypothetical protein
MTVSGSVSNSRITSSMDYLTGQNYSIQYYDVTCSSEDMSSLSSDIRVIT